jgi:hypothetical protein
MVTFRGILDFQYTAQDSGDLFVDTVAFVYSYRLPGSGKELEGVETRYGSLSWSNLSGSTILPEVHTIADLVQQKHPGVTSIDYDEPTGES